jgi:Flp pilus assembly protein TadB
VILAEGARWAGRLPAGQHGGVEDRDLGDEHQADGEPELDSVAAEAAQRPGHPAAYAVNWRQVLLVDASMGVAVFVAGIVVMAVWSVPIGAAVGALGAAYVAAVFLRYRRWKATREDAGLPT